MFHTIQFAAEVVALPDGFVKTARNCAPESASAAVPESMVLVAPATSVQLAP